ncbi:hypothetical protein [Corynebacterium sp. TAE3-ERU16]|uniref:hypothetical protein n=1 Tax=Corynebacterium sp. TAE3-ERU16 TaxID=2849493 RepID=UPI001C44F803|nr:hypothetical protein [Corynebacterium sp. TAE3-ERU16]MBV7292387.1 hypothetical protein [Corynebacterium sp. TAE3-ERU16]
MDSTTATTLSSIVVALLAGFWGWLQSREHHKGEESKIYTQAAFDLNERMESNLKLADARADEFRREALELRDGLSKLRDEYEGMSRDMGSLNETVDDLKRRLTTSNKRLVMAMQHINLLQKDIKAKYPGVDLRPIPTELNGIDNG